MLLYLYIIRTSPEERNEQNTHSMSLICLSASLSPLKITTCSLAKETDCQTSIHVSGGPQAIDFLKWLLTTSVMLEIWSQLKIVHVLFVVRAGHLIHPLYSAHLWYILKTSWKPLVCDCCTRLSEISKQALKIECDTRDLYISWLTLYSRQTFWCWSPSWFTTARG